MQKVVLASGALAFLVLWMLAGCATQRNYSSPSDLAQLISAKSERYSLVDVRTAGEYMTGHIPTAVNIPVAEIDQNPPVRDKDELIIVYCQSGHRSSKAASILRQNGFTHVVDFGSILNWKGTLIKGERSTKDTGQ